MNCPICNNPYPTQEAKCSQCGFDLNQIKWESIAKTYPPQDIIIESLLSSANIPVRLIKKEVYGFPVVIGPLAEVKILVPEQLINEAKHIINEIKLPSEWEET